MPHPASPIRVMIADDHPVVREGLCALLRRRDIAVVSEASNGREAIEEFSQRRPDVVLMDLRMPEMGGLEAIRAIIAKAPKARILVLTTYDGDEDIFRALRAGALGYVLKDCTREQLMEAVHTVHLGKNWLSAAASNKLAARVGQVQLTSREEEVLRLLATGKSNKEIGSQLDITEGTVKVHVTRILKKLRVTGRSQAITEALKRGLVHLDQAVSRG